MAIMPRALLPVKRPETDSGLVPRMRRVAFRPHENKRQKSATGLKEKNAIVSRRRKKSCKVEIQDLNFDVIQVSVVGDQVRKVPQDQSVT
jgi:hypothetical protein